jgi:hemerythrin superfamily protein
MDAITLLKDDHKTVEKLFKQFEQAGDRAFVTKRDVVDRIIEELATHAIIEEQLFYPATRATVPEVEDTALESIEEHNIVKWVLAELDGMDPEHERFDAKVTVLIENVRHHVEEEEGDYFPKVRAELGRNALADLGDAMTAAREVAPTKAHPRSPDTPPGNMVVGTAVGVADRVTDTVSGTAQGAVTAVGDVVARVLGRPRRASSPTGSSIARKRAEQVRKAAASTTDSVIEATRRAKAEGEATGEKAAETASTARTGAKRTATTAKRRADETRSAAKGAATTAKRGADETRSAAKGAATTAKRGADETRSAAKGAATSTVREAKAS